MRQDQICSPTLFVNKFNNAYVMAVTHSSRTSDNGPDDNNNDDNDDASGNDAARPIAGPSKRRRTSPEVSSAGEESSEIEDDGRPRSGPPSGVPSTVGDDEDLDADAARIDANLVASVGNAAADGGDE